jgi:hypothetical protein
MWWEKKKIKKRYLETQIKFKNILFILFSRNIRDAKYLQKYTVDLAQSLRVGMMSRAVSHEKNARPRSRGMEERD